MLTLTPWSAATFGLVVLCWMEDSYKFGDVAEMDVAAPGLCGSGEIREYMGELVKHSWFVEYRMSLML
jgi:hypothetical protein